MTTQRSNVLRLQLDPDKYLFVTAISRRSTAGVNTTQTTANIKANYPVSPVLAFLKECGNASSGFRTAMLGVIQGTRMNVPESGIGTQTDPQIPILNRIIPVTSRPPFNLGWDPASHAAHASSPWSRISSSTNEWVRASVIGSRNVYTARADYIASSEPVVREISSGSGVYRQYPTDASSYVSASITWNVEQRGDGDYPGDQGPFVWWGHVVTSGVLSTPYRAPLGSSGITGADTHAQIATKLRNQDLKPSFRETSYFYSIQTLNDDLPHSVTEARAHVPPLVLPKANNTGNPPNRYKLYGHLAPVTVWFDPEGPEQLMQVNPRDPTTNPPRRLNPRHGSMVTKADATWSDVNPDDVFFGSQAVSLNFDPEDIPVEGAGLYDMTYVVQDRNGDEAETRILVLVYNEGEPSTIQTPSFEHARYDYTYFENVEARTTVLPTVRGHRPLAHRWVSGDLPEGMWIRHVGGGRAVKGTYYEGPGQFWLLGTPTETGTYNIVYGARDGAGVEATTTLRIVVEAQDTEPRFPHAQYTVNFDINVAVTSSPISLALSGNAPVRYNLVGTLPTGMRVEDADGGKTFPVDKQLVLKGTPTEVGFWSPQVTATDRDGDVATTRLNITVRNPQDMDEPEFPQNRYAFTLTTGVDVGKLEMPLAEGGDAPVTYSLGTGGEIPSGLTLDTSADPPVLTGTPDTMETTTIVWTATDNDGDEDSVNVDFIVNDPEPPAPAPFVWVGAEVSDLTVNVGDTVRHVLRVATGGTPPLGYSVEGLPPWLTLDTSTAVPQITGTAQVGVWLLTLVATDSANGRLTDAFTITVVDTDVENIVRMFAQGSYTYHLTRGQVVNQSMPVATEGNGESTYRHSGTLPGGLQILDGMLTGRVDLTAELGTYDLVWEALDGGVSEASTNVTIQVSESFTPPDPVEGAISVWTVIPRGLTGIWIGDELRRYVLQNMEYVKDGVDELGG